MSRRDDLAQAAFRCSQVAFNYNVIALAIRELPTFRDTPAYGEYLEALNETMRKMHGLNLTDTDIATFEEVTSRTLAAVRDFIPQEFQRRLEESLAKARSQL